MRVDRSALLESADAGVVFTLKYREICLNINKILTRQIELMAYDLCGLKQRCIAPMTAYDL